MFLDVRHYSQERCPPGGSDLNRQPYWSSLLGDSSHLELTTGNPSLHAHMHTTSTSGLLGLQHNRFRDTFYNNEMSAAETGDNQERQFMHNRTRDILHKHLHRSAVWDNEPCKTNKYFLKISTAVSVEMNSFPQWMFFSGCENEPSIRHSWLLVVMIIAPR